MRFQNLTDKRFGRLTVISRAQNNGRHVVWLCQCDCGNMTTIQATNLSGGRSTSCGCYQKEIVTTHNMSHSPEHVAWTAMKSRCYTKSNVSYKYYGERGVTVCERWLHSFENFFSDMGNKPSREHSLDRIDTFGNYSPDNCRWVEREIQSNNRRNNHRLTFGEETKTVSQWARTIKLSKSCIAYRLSSGWSIEDTLTKPSRRSTSAQPWRG